MQEQQRAAVTSSRSVGAWRTVHVVFAVTVVVTGVTSVHALVVPATWPGVPGLIEDATTYRVVLGYFWPLYTIFGFLGLSRYRAGEPRAAASHFVVLAVLALAPLVHLVHGPQGLSVPVLVLVLTSGVAGGAMLATSWWLRRQSPAVPTAT